MNHGYETASPDRYAILKVFAKENRNHPTEAERLMWNVLRSQFSGVRFRRQHPIGDYIVDFVCLQKRLIIEVDGGYHGQPAQRSEDEARTLFMEKAGYSVLRFRNKDVIQNIQEVISQIKSEIIKEETI